MTYGESAECDVFAEAAHVTQIGHEHISELNERGYVGAVLGNSRHPVVVGLNGIKVGFQSSPHIGACANQVKRLMYLL